MKKIISISLALTLALGFASVSATELNVIPFPKGIETTKEGASSYQNSGDHKDSPYFSHPDFYNMKSTDTLTILEKFKTYQQTSEVTCGPASALTVLHHYKKNTNYNEMQIAEIMQTHKDKNKNNKEEPGVANERGEYGTSTDGMVAFFKKIGWNVTSSLDSKNGASFDDPAKFQDWVISNLKKNTPIMIEWLDWSGHWQTIIGYDTMGTESFGDDVIIVADPYDTSDHLQDGYYILNAERFFYMWSDKGILPEDQSEQQWVIATPPATKAK